MQERLILHTHARAFLTTSSWLELTDGTASRNIAFSSEVEISPHTFGSEAMATAAKQRTIRTFILTGEFDLQHQPITERHSPKNQSRNFFSCPSMASRRSVVLDVRRDATLTSSKVKQARVFSLCIFVIAMERQSLSKVFEKFPTRFLPSKPRKSQVLFFVFLQCLPIFTATSKKTVCPKFILFLSLLVKLAFQTIFEEVKECEAPSLT